MRKRISGAIRTCVALAIAFFLISEPAFAQFYKGKTLTVLINFTPGGPTDIEGRLVAKYLQKYIPGNPNIVVENMGGASGADGTNYLAKVARADGLTLGFFTWNPLDPILDAPGIAVSYSDFKLVASARSAVLTYVRKDVSPGVEKPADIANVKNIVFGGIRPDVHTDLRARMALDMLGVNYKYTTGIVGLQEAMLDLWRGEIQMTGTSLPAYREQVEPSLVASGIAIPLYQYAALKPDGSGVRDPELPEVPTFLDLYRQIYGATKTPSGIMWDSFNVINTFFGNMNRIVVFPPGTNEQAVDIMRAAFLKLERNQDFISDYKTVIKSTPDFLDGAASQQIMARLSSVSPDVKSFLKSYVAKVIPK